MKNTEYLKDSFILPEINSYVGSFDNEPIVQKIKIANGSSETFWDLIYFEFRSVIREDL